MNSVKVSVITVWFNNAKRIEDTIRSILRQVYKDIEYVFVDGGSTDGTLEAIRKYENRISISQYAFPF